MRKSRPVPCERSFELQREFRPCFRNQRSASRHRADRIDFTPKRREWLGCRVHEFVKDDVVGDGFGICDAIERDDMA